jgi:hypothetical protein
MSEKSGKCSPTLNYRHPSKAPTKFRKIRQNLRGSEKSIRILFKKIKSKKICGFFRLIQKSHTPLRSGLPFDLNDKHTRNVGLHMVVCGSESQELSI